MGTFTKEQFDTDLEYSIEFMKKYSPFRYLVRNFPIRVDEGVAPYHLNLMKKNNIAAMCTGDYIAVNSDQLYQDIKDARAKDTKKAYFSAADNCKTVLAHEYNHLLLEHQRELDKYLSTKPDHIHEMTYRMAQDVIANRGMGVDPCVMRDSFVTDLSLGEIGVKDLTSVYTVEEVQQKILELFASPSGGSGSGDTKESDNKEDNKDGDEESDKKKAEQEERKKQLMAKTEEESKAPNMAPQKSVADMLGLDDDSEDLGASDHGAGGLGSDDKRTPREVLSQYNDKYKQKQIAKNLSRLRGIIQGDLGKAKTKTYSRPPRRTVEGDLLKKGDKRDRRSTPSILVALDSSGSMNSVKVNEVAVAIDSIVKQLGRNTSNCYICLHDGNTHHENKLKDWRETTSCYHANGGNNFGNVYELAKQKNCKVVLNVGDGLDRVTVNRGKAPVKKDYNDGIIWYDVIVSEMESSSDSYYGLCRVDAERGLKRKQIDLCNGLIPERDVPEKHIESCYNCYRTKGHWN